MNYNLEIGFDDELFSNENNMLKDWEKFYSIKKDKPIKKEKIKVIKK